MPHRYLILLIISGCVREDDTTAPQAVTCGGAPTLAAIQDGIFSKSCAFGSCHAGANPAAGLDLSAGRSCSALVGAPSCLFSQRTRVVAGQPNQSYLIDKLLGRNLGANPDGPCRAAANGAPQAMPLGGAALCAGKIDQLRRWITEGALCGEHPAPDGGSSDAAVDGSLRDGGGDGAPIVELLLASDVVLAGDPRGTLATATLDRPAPPGGQVLWIQSVDPDVLATPAQVTVPDGQTSASFVVLGLRPARARRMIVRSGGTFREAALRVSGLALVEVFYDAPGGDDAMEWVVVKNTGRAAIDLGHYSLGAGSTTYAYLTAPLADPAHPTSLVPGACATIGGPSSSAANGMPVYSYEINLGGTDRDLPNATASHGAGVGLFDVDASANDGTVTPIDAVVYGPNNLGGLKHASGDTGDADVPSVVAGKSIRRSIRGWGESIPMPNVCPEP
jgi:hypothetical protein